MTVGSGPAPWQVTCRHCGFPNPPRHRYCGRCGDALGRSFGFDKLPVLLLVFVGFFSVLGGSLLALTAAASIDLPNLNPLQRPRRTPLAVAIITATPTVTPTATKTPTPTATATPPPPSVTATATLRPPPTPTEPSAPPPTRAPAAATPTPRPAAATPTRVSGGEGNAVAAPTIGNVVVIRVLPKTSAAVAGYVFAGDRVEIIRLVTGEAVEPGDTRWYEIRANGVTGYVYAVLIKPTA